MKDHTKDYLIDTDTLVDFFLEITLESTSISYLETYEIIYGVLRDKRGKSLLQSVDDLFKVFDWAKDINIEYIIDKDVREEVDKFFEEVDEHNLAINFKHFVTVMVSHFQGMYSGEDEKDYDLIETIDLYVKFILNRGMMEKALIMLKDIYEEVDPKILREEVEFAQQKALEHLYMFPAKI